MMNKLVIVGVVFWAVSIWGVTNANVKDCLNVDVAAMKALTVDDTIHLTCNLNLDADNTIKAHLVLQGAKSSGVSVDCGGGKLYKVTIRSSHGSDIVSGDPWIPVTDVTIRHCTVLGPIQVTGMGPTAHHSRFVLASTHRTGHVEKVRAVAPTRITLDDLVVVGGGSDYYFETEPWRVKGWTPLFVGPGVSYLSLKNSELTGVSPGPGLYLDSESHHNTIQDNYIHVNTKSEKWWINHFREQIAVDNSSSNIIINNSFAALLGGGVHLYRNCGEDGAVRHTTPHHNHIINNYFYYSSGFDKDSPAIFVGSRDGTQRDYCHLDDPWSGGSADDDRSFARYNVVAQNQIRKLSTSKMIKVGDSSNYPNFIDHNDTVQSQIVRQAGCYRSDGTPKFVRDGETMSPTGGTVPIWSCSNHKLGLVPQLIMSVM